MVLDFKPRTGFYVPRGLRTIGIDLPSPIGETWGLEPTIHDEIGTCFVTVTHTGLTVIGRLGVVYLEIDRSSGKDVAIGGLGVAKERHSPPGYHGRYSHDRTQAHY